MTGYIDKVLKGADPGTLPVEKVTRYELTVNLKASRDIGVTVPSDVLYNKSPLPFVEKSLFSSIYVSRRVDSESLYRSQPAPTLMHQPYQ
jgi:hypothetical protein